jgi:hypothetical protein
MRYKVSERLIKRLALFLTLVLLWAFTVIAFLLDDFGNKGSNKVSNKGQLVAIDAPSETVLTASFSRTAKPITTSNIPYASMQRCIDEYTSNGAWKGDTWTTTLNHSTCGFRHWSVEQLPSVLRPFRLGFMGDSTTRSDLRAFEEMYDCPKTDLDEMAVFQKKGPDGRYICDLSEQSRNLTKCGIPPIVDMTCREVSFLYFYKVYPWTSLDEWYVSQPDLFRNIDVLVISLGRWFVYYQPYGTLNVTRDMDTFMVSLKRVFSGTVLYQSEYAAHAEKSRKTVYPVNCSHGACQNCDQNDEAWECVQTVTLPRPRSDLELRSVVERHQVLYLDRWNISKSLPLEYYQLWYCNTEFYHEWSCDHHLHFVALQHLRLIANVVTKILGGKLKTVLSPPK